MSSEISDELHGSLNTLLACSKPPLGIFCYHDLLAVETQRAVKTSRYERTNIPDDICIVGFDDLPVTCDTVPHLSSVSYRYDSLSSIATERMLSRCEGRERGAPVEIFVPSALIVRNSSSR